MTGVAKYGVVGLMAIACATPAKPISQPRPPEPPDTRRYLVERVGDIALIQLYADGFEQLSQHERLVAYYLYRAALAGRDIAWDQNHREALKLRRLIEEIVTHATTIPTDIRARLVEFAKVLWIHNGNYHDRTKAKIVPNFSFEELVLSAEAAQKDGAKLPLDNDLRTELGALRRTIFDRTFEPLIVAKEPPKGEDILTASANNYYFGGVRMSDIEGFKEKYPLNSRLVRKNGSLVEEIYRAGLPSPCCSPNPMPPGRYSAELHTVIRELNEARKFASPAQQKTLSLLIDYFMSGDPKKFDEHSIAWLKDTPRVDTINGFIEVYKDPRGQKGEYEALVSFIDPETSRVMHAIAKRAQEFEDKMPWRNAFKRRGVTVPVANAIRVRVGVGGGGPSTPSGINLPNAEWIREKHGSKSVLLINVMKSRDRALKASALAEFALPEERERAKRYGEAAWNALVAMHEVIGHGSGKVSEALKGDPSTHLKEYGSALEEARADLVALWHMFDPALVETGVLPNRDAAIAAYEDYARQDLMMLYKLSGERIEDDHQRAEHLVVGFLRDAGAVVVERIEGRAYFRVPDVERMRASVGKLLAELMRIKAEGDYRGAKRLFERFGIEIDQKLRDEVVARARAINLPHYFACVMPELEAVKDGAGRVVDARVVYPKSFEDQMLRFRSLSAFERPR
ncbi:MAG: peptidase M49 [Deltaproteobacteria bacterium]|nr:peptidase M49 [Deltaproteobacteria bacterium]